MMVDRGKLDYEAPIARYWPEFGAHGKHNITLRDLIMHRAGLHYVCDGDEETVDDLALWDLESQGDGYLDECAAVFQRAKPNWPEASRTAYHGITRDMILNEVFRRVDGRTLGTFIEEEISRPLGIEYYVGVPPSEIGRVHLHVGDTVAWALGNLFRLIFGYFRGTLPTSPQDEGAVIGDIVRHGLNSPLLKLSGGLPVHKFVDVHNEPVLLQRESPSSNGITNARGLATIGTVLSGATHARLFNESARKQFFSLEEGEHYDGVLHTWLHFTRGGIACWDQKWGPFAGWCGWHGIGGQAFLMDPVRDIVVVKLTTGFGSEAPWRDVRNLRILRALAKDLQANGL